jgi:hypothetical protein
LFYLCSALFLLNVGGNQRRTSMKKFLAIIALGTVIAAPAFAQSAPSARQDNRTFHQQSSSRVHPYAADRSYSAPGYGYNNNDNPDFQLGGGER